MTEIVFHLGDRKTGSTSIQTTLATGAWRCETRRLVYPTRGLNHVPLARAISGDLRGQKPGRPLEARFAALRREIAGADVAVISAEHFESVAPEALEAAIRTHLPGLPVRLIAYVRPHPERIASEFAEQVKQGRFFGTMDELHARTLERRRFFYHPRFSRWRAVFGDRFTLRPMVRSRLRGADVVTDLLDFALSGAPFVLTGAAPANESLGLEDLAVLRELQSRLAGDRAEIAALQAPLGWAVARRLATTPPQGTRVRLHRALAEEVARVYREDAAALDADFFAAPSGTGPSPGPIPDGPIPDDRPMSAALEAAPGRALAEPQSACAEDIFTPRELRLIGFMADQLAELLTATPEVWPDFFSRSHLRQLLGRAPAPAAAPAIPPAADPPDRPRRKRRGPGPGRRAG